ncbi:LysE family translocator [Nonomuraea dietziae]|uniref:Threonine/homoserine/homoserine lactone efflux protein n=1 Tax=Nonomuraea dietziae TaxID=65515 RepID=A0A7W5VB57_9ACTN|nr:LysE family transporter [Nonomuraea dietziae]MBB3734037.1 threonine/homoserine/homoserine lactone efflux protein [Nonomuraea dietziae]
MTGLIAYVGIVGAVLLGAASPGPSFIVVAQTAMSASRRTALSVAIGIGLGGLFFASLALGGLVTLFSLVDPLYAILKVLGACYLLYLAFRIWRSARESFTLENASAHTSARWAIKGPNKMI